MKKLEMKPAGFPLKLKECPPGFFLFEDSVCFKSEYGGEAFCATGESFCGPSLGKRDELTVQPLIYEWVNYEE